MLIINVPTCHVVSSILSHPLCLPYYLHRLVMYNVGHTNWDVYYDLCFIHMWLTSNMTPCHLTPILIYKELFKTRSSTVPCTKWNYLRCSPNDPHNILEPHGQSPYFYFKTSQTSRLCNFLPIAWFIPWGRRLSYVKQTLSMMCQNS